MRLLKRRAAVGADTGSPDPTVREQADAGRGIEELQAEIVELEAAVRAHPDLDGEQRLIWLRHLVGVQRIDAAAADPDFAAPDDAALPPRGTTPETWLPEIDPDQLTPGLLRAGILRDGCLLVRGLVPREDALALGQEIDQAFAERARQTAGDGGSRPDRKRYSEFRPSSRYGDVFGRPWIERGGGVLAADAPEPHFRMMELFRGAAVRELATGYLGEPALISVHKTTLRKADPTVSGAWHQDGYFMGPVRSLNLWLSLSRCGDESPGMDIVPTRLEEYVTTATEDAELDYTISQQRVDAARGATPILRPIFEPGDALFFDELFLHQTASDPAMPNVRYAVENWLFGPSAFPAEYAPIAV